VLSFLRFDLGAMYTRDIVLMEKWISAWIGQKQATYDDLPISVIYLTDFFPIPNAEQIKLIDTFIANLEAIYGVTREKVSIVDT